jgi:structural maintenance of chromosome 4
MAVYEKQEVGLEEKCKHANSKAKKLKKSLQDVSFLAPRVRVIILADWSGPHQDENARNDALRAIQDNAAKMKSERKKADQFEEELQREEKALEGIRDSLKGMGFSVFVSDDRVLTVLSDKTQVFHDQIEQKQRELQPWKTRINQKQAEIDVKTSERDMLVKKAEGIRQAGAEAQEALESLKSEQKTKVCAFGDYKLPMS